MNSRGVVAMSLRARTALNTLVVNVVSVVWRLNDDATIFKWSPFAT
jgi:hypothetical protein